MFNNNDDFQNTNTNNQELKRKIDFRILLLNEDLSNKEYKIYQKYKNPTNCDNISLYDNHIYFNALINNENINKLNSYIQIIINNLHLLPSNISIYLHINSKGGILNALHNFINLKQIITIEIISIIENEVNDSAIILAALCNYRIIKKNAYAKLSNYHSEYSYPNYWNYFKQCENNICEINILKKNIYCAFCELIDSKITKEKLDKYLDTDRIWDAKKCKKLGIVDEIILI